MQVLTKGQYTGEVIQKLNQDNCLITNTLYSDKTSSGEWHSHENLHMCFVFQGGKAETKKRTKYTDVGGTLFFYRSGQVHRWLSPQATSKSANLEIGPDFLRKFDLTEQSIEKSIASRYDVKSLILKIQAEMIANDKSSALGIQTSLLELLSYPINHGSRRNSLPSWIPVLRELLHDRWNLELTLADISAIVNVHPVTISKNFRKYFSCTLGEYRRKLKVEKSIDLINSTSYTLSEIAHICDFSDQSHFIRIFKENTNFLPNDFRRL